MPAVFRPAAACGVPVSYINPPEDRSKKLAGVVDALAEPISGPVAVPAD
ncbi:hypothetical protein [Streptosporangium lutulentum]|uniref:Uncharacterized protein n=1 Tax=Streptosporangium lutulentum TaxID=1461250 RepID=A0ABT9QFM4_9ACTN|nr:hypothetical protein [Streptosporangium lutulentum]MDP9845577.1 hypothetical protein [Streptosporangium lutulentum]